MTVVDHNDNVLGCSTGCAPDLPAGRDHEADEALAVATPGPPGTAADVVDELAAFAARGMTAQAAVDTLTERPAELDVVDQARATSTPAEPAAVDTACPPWCQGGSHRWRYHESAPVDLGGPHHPRLVATRNVTDPQITFVRFTPDPGTTVADDNESAMPVAALGRAIGALGVLPRGPLSDAEVAAARAQLVDDEQRIGGHGLALQPGSAARYLADTVARMVAGEPDPFEVVRRLRVAYAAYTVLAAREEVTP